MEFSLLHLTSFHFVLLAKLLYGDNVSSVAIQGAPRAEYLAINVSIFPPGVFE